MAKVGPIKMWPMLDLYQYVEEYAQKLNKQLAEELSKPSPILDLFAGKIPPDGPTKKLKYKSSHASIPISKEAVEKMWPSPPLGQSIGLGTKYIKQQWSCGCFEATDQLSGSFHCHNWFKRPNSCDRRRQGG